MKIMNKKRFVLTSLLFFFIALGTTAILTEKSFSGKPAGSGPENPASIANMVVVAKSAGDFDSIQAAIDSITPTADSPYLIEVMPGTYIENITMKSYVHIKGAGRDVTKIQLGSANEIITFNGVDHASIEGFTLDCDGVGNSRGIGNVTSSPSISGNTITSCRWGIYNESGSSPIIRNNIILVDTWGIYEDSSSSIIQGNIVKGLVVRGSTGIVVRNGSTSTISGNVIEEIGADGISCEGSNVAATISGNKIINNFNDGISKYCDGTLTITGNIITGNAGEGVYLSYGSGTTIINNKITDNAIDIKLRAGSSNISFNIFDAIQGTSWEGSYNVKSDGTAW